MIKGEIFRERQRRKLPKKKKKKQGMGGLGGERESCVFIYLEPGSMLGFVAVDL